MAGVGILIPDDTLEDYVREAANLPERTVDTREIDPKRQKQQNQYEPPEEDGENTEESEEDEEKVEEAKKRLGRILRK